MTNTLTGSPGDGCDCRCHWWKPRRLRLCLKCGRYSHEWPPAVTHVQPPAPDPLVWEHPHSAFTGLPNRDGVPCSDCHHVAMFLPEGQPYDCKLWRCSECQNPAGFHFRSATCGPTAHPASEHPHRVSYYRDPEGAG